ncbi:MAG: histidine phosphatase family protein [Candidatus Velthaea sp.]
MRHGRTAWNRERRFQGHTDVPLDEEGRAQAQALAAYLADERFDLALASDLARAWETAAAIGAAAGVRVEREPRLREMRFGDWEGLRWDEIVARTPGLAHASEKAPRSYVPKGGEAFEDVCARVAPVIAAVAQRLPPEGRALIVSHAGVMHALLRVALGEAGAAALNVTFVPAAIMRLTGSGLPGAPWSVLRVNETAVPESRPPRPGSGSR